MFVEAKTAMASPSIAIDDLEEYSALRRSGLKSTSTLKGQRQSEPW
jgi:hypothetical protein